MAAFAIVLVLGVGLGAFACGWIFHEERDRNRA